MRDLGPFRPEATEPGVPPRAFHAAHGDRNARLRSCLRGRDLYLALCEGKVHALQGFAPDPASAAAATRRWLSGAGPGAVAAAWPFLGSVRLAEARERGDRAEAKWLWLYENHCHDPIAARLRSFVAVAFHEPRLRRLLPFTSHWTLRFSVTPSHPFQVVGPMIDPGDVPDMFVVRARDGRTPEEVSAADALRLVLAELDRGL